MLQSIITLANSKYSIGTLSCSNILSTFYMMNCLETNGSVTYSERTPENVIHVDCRIILLPE